MTPISPETLKVLQLSMLKGVGPAALKNAVNQIKNFAQADILEISKKVASVGRAISSNNVWDEACQKGIDLADEASRRSARIISPFDEDYPKLLSQTRDDPFILFIQGILPPFPDRTVAIIGTREPTEHGEKIAERITSYFVEKKWSILSGLAIGCDAIAHKTALSRGGHTVAVLAHGLHTIAPSRHKKLAEEILGSGGALISEYRFGQEVQKQQYVKRDKTQAGLSCGVVMIQSDLVGGSLHASRAALEYSRWLAVPLPTEKDRNSLEPKVQANLLIANGNDDERMALLRCNKSALSNIFILESKRDYEKIFSTENNKDLENNFESQKFNNEIIEDSNYYRSQEFVAIPNKETDYSLAKSILKKRKKHISIRKAQMDALIDCFADSSELTILDIHFEFEDILRVLLVFLEHAEKHSDFRYILGRKNQHELDSIKSKIEKIISEGDLFIFHSLLKSIESLENNSNSAIDLLRTHPVCSEEFRLCYSEFQKLAQLATKELD